MNEILKIILSLSFSASLIVLVLFALRPLYKARLHKAWQYYIWLIVVVRLIIPYTPEVNLFGQLLQIAKQVQSVQSQPENTVNYATDYVTPQWKAPIVDKDSSAGIDVPFKSLRPSPLDELWNNLWLIWLGVVIVLFVRKVTSYYSFTRFIQAGRQSIDDPEVLDTYYTVCEEMGIKRPLPLYANRLAVSPMLVGILRPYLVLPDLSLADDKLRMVFRHELIHYRRRDILYKWLVQFVVCLHWFNPLVYLMGLEIGKLCELSCDEAALRRLDTEEKRRYGDTLLATLKGGGNYGDIVASITMSEDAKMLKDRLEAILVHGKKPRIVVVYSVLLTIVLLGCTAYAGAYTGARSGANPVVMAADNLKTFTETPNIDSSILSVPEQKNDKNENLSSSFTYFQSIYYQDKYIFSISWKKDNDIEQQITTAQVQCAGETFTVAFDNEAASYAEEQKLLEAIGKAIGDIVSRSVGVNWKERFFLITELSGPYMESPDQLLINFYDHKNFDYFIAVLPHAEQKTVQTLITRAYEDNRGEYMMYLADALHKEVDLDVLADRAVGEGRTDMLLYLMDHLSAAKRQELMDIAFAEGRTDLVSLLMDELPNINEDAMAQKAYDNKNTAMFSLFADEISTSKVKELAERTFTEDQIAFFSMVMDQLTHEEVASYAKRAFADGMTDFASMLSDELSSSELKQYAEQAFINGETGMFSLLMDELSEDVLADYAHRAYESGNIAFFSMLMDNLTDEVISEYAQRAFKEQKHNFQSILMDYIS